MKFGINKNDNNELTFSQDLAKLLPENELDKIITFGNYLGYEFLIIGYFNDNETETQFQNEIKQELSDLDIETTGFYLINRQTKHYIYISCFFVSEIKEIRNPFNDFNTLIPLAKDLLNKKMLSPFDIDSLKNKILECNINSLKDIIYEIIKKN